MTDEDFERIIEELEAKLALVMAERNEAWRRAGNAEEQWGRCEAKLAKAVEGLREIAGFAEKEWVTPSGEAPPDVQNLCDIARALLAEIEGLGVKQTG
jgi:hypothetical protein